MAKKKTIKIEKLRKMIEIDSFLLKNLNVFSLKMLKILIMRESVEEEKLINNRKQLYSDKKFLERHGKFKDFINVALDRFTQQQDIQCVLQKNQIEKNIKKPRKSKILKV